MGARSGQRIKIVRVLEILRRYSDEQHPITAAFICERLAEMGVSAERKSVYGDLAELEYCGYDIVKDSDPKKGWFLAERELELPEVYLLCDAVRSANFITVKKTRELLEKLNGMLSIHQAAQTNKNIYHSYTGKSANEEIYYSIDSLSNAVLRGKKVTFDYIRRTFGDGRTMVKEKTQRTVSPYALVWQDDHYYLIGNYEKYDNLAHFRVDRMKNVRITEQSARPFSQVCEYRDSFDVADYTAKLFSMHSGELCEIELQCQRSLAEQVADRFSEEIFIRDLTEDTFRFSVRAALSEALVTWILNYGDKIRVLSPETLRERVKQRAKDVLALYE